MSTPDPTTIGMLLTAITGLGTAIGVLWRQVTKHFLLIEAKLSECERDRDRLHEDQTNLWRQLAKQAGQPVDDLRKTSTRNE